jgi:hypothetical protein
MFDDRFAGIDSDKLRDMSNEFIEMTREVDVDLLQDGEVNKFIVGNVYDNDLVITGRLTVLGMSYDSDEGMSSNIKTYVENVACNLVYQKFAGVDTQKLTDMSNELERVIRNVNLDQIQDGYVNKYIVNNVYDNDLTVVGKLTVNALEVTSLGVKIEADDGSIMNTDLQGYVDYKVSNMFDDRFAGIDSDKLRDMSNEFIEMTREVDVDLLQDGEVNKFIVGNVYDNDLVITGRLTVLGMSYDSDEGMSSNIKTYIQNVASNIFENAYSDTDHIAEGDQNKFIVNNVYDNDLVITGKLTVLGMSYDTNPSENSNIRTYIDHAISRELEGIDTRRLIDMSNELEGIVREADLDKFTNGQHNKFITNNIYDDDLTVTGKLTVDSLEVISLKVTYEASNGSVINSDIKSYVDFVASNIVKEQYFGINDELLQNMSNEFAEAIRGIHVDRLVDGVNKKFIVNNVYDDDLIVTGKMTVSMLEVTDLGMVYESGDGNVVNSDIKAYVDQHTKMDYTFKVEIQDEEGNLICEVDKVVYIRKKSDRLKN